MNLIDNINFHKSFNCAKVYVGTYVGGDTNEFERGITCRFKLLDGKITVKRLRPIRIKWTTSEPRDSLLRCFLIYPKTPKAIIRVNDARGCHTLNLLKVERGKKRKMFKAYY